jgi:hypothetical protein
MMSAMAYLAVASRENFIRVSAGIHRLEEYHYPTPNKMRFGPGLLGLGLPTRSAAGHFQQLWVAPIRDRVFDAVASRPLRKLWAHQGLNLNPAEKENRGLTTPFFRTNSVRCNRAFGNSLI